jgi:Dolichyl-phosphate-mannose-protein mannosyltransferase
VNALVRVVRIATLAGASLFPVAYLTLAVLRLGHPFELEWMEGGTLQHVQRVLAGEPLYVAPTLAFVPFIYAPAYYYAAAATAALLGDGFAPLRLVSLLASLGCFALVLAIVRRETRDREAALLAACLLAATYAESGTFFDLARADSLYLLLLLAAAAVARFGATARASVACAVLVALACLTKQPALLAVPALALVQARRGRRQLIAFLSALAGVLGGAVALLNVLHDGWFLYYVHELSGQGPIKRVLVTFWARDVLSPFSVAALLTAAGLGLRRARGGARDAGDWAWLVAALVTPAWGSRFNVGSDVNVLMPMHAALAIGFGLAWHEIRLRLEALPADSRAPAAAMAWVACLAQFARLVYSPAPLVPRPADREAGQAFVRALRDLPSPVFLPNHPYLLERAGLPAHAHQVGINQILNGAPGAWRDRIAAEQRGSIRERRYGAVVLDGWFWFKDDVERCYRPLRPAIGDPAAFWPVAGARLRPETIYVPAESCR